MLQVAPSVRVYLACRPTDMRKGFDGLSAEVAQVLKADPFSGGVFIFRSKRADYLKILTWDGSGLCSPSGSRRASSYGPLSWMVR
jgi:transposase